MRTSQALLKFVNSLSQLGSSLLFRLVQELVVLLANKGLPWWLLLFEGGPLTLPPLTPPAMYELFNPKVFRPELKEELKLDPPFPLGCKRPLLITWQKKVLKHSFVASLNEIDLNCSRFFCNLSTHLFEFPVLGQPGEWHDEAWSNFQQNPPLHFWQVSEMLGFNKLTSQVHQNNGYLLQTALLLRSQNRSIAIYSIHVTSIEAQHELPSSSHCEHIQHNITSTLAAAFFSRNRNREVNKQTT